MKELQEKILKDGKVIGNNILKVDNFLNHQIDVSLFLKIGEAFYNKFKDKNINKIVTIESSGIAVAFATSLYFNNIPVVFIKKQKSLIHDDNILQTNVHSFTKNIDYTASINKEYLTENDRVLFIDDFLANGEACLGAIDLCHKANAKVEAIGIVIEKSFQKGASELKEMGYDVYSLARIKSFEINQVIFKERD